MDLQGFVATLELRVQPIELAAVLPFSYTKPVSWIKNIHSLVSQQGSRYIWTLLLCRVSDSPASLLRERWICYLVCSNPVTHRGKILINCKVG